MHAVDFCVCVFMVEEDQPKFKRRIIFHDKYLHTTIARQADNKEGREKNLENGTKFVKCAAIRLS